MYFGAWLLTPDQWNQGRHGYPRICQFTIPWRSVPAVPPTSSRNADDYWNEPSKRTIAGKSSPNEICQDHLLVGAIICAGTA